MKLALRSFFLMLALLFGSLEALASVNINSATVEELDTLPGIGPSKAAAIVQYRTDNGPFKTVDELENVTGIGPSTLASIRDLVSIGASTGATTTATTTEPAATTTTTTSASAGCPVNVNTADATALMDLPGIGESKAAAIVQDRTDNGAYGSCDDLDRVSGIGPATIANLRACCTVR